MSLREKILNQEFVVTSELGPPKGVEIKELLEKARSLKGYVDALNVTDLQSSVMRLGSLAVSHLLKEEGLEPVFQITCRDRNRLALQSDVLSAAVLGIENILALTGDHPSLGDHPQAKPVFDLDSVQLLRTIKGLEEGRDMVGNRLKGVPKFFLGAVVNPGADPLEPEIFKMEKKISSGAEFFQTQAVFDLKKYEDFLKRTRHLKVPILAGIVLLKSAKMAQFMNEHVSGIEVPEELIKEMQEAKDKKEKSVEIAVRIIKGLKDMCQGIHIMSLGWEELVPRIVENIR